MAPFLTQCVVPISLLRLRKILNACQKLNTRNCSLKFSLMSVKIHQFLASIKKIHTHEYRFLFFCLTVYMLSIASPASSGWHRSLARRRPPLSRTRRIQYDAAAASVVVCARRRNDVTRYSDIDRCSTTWPTTA